MDLETVFRGVVGREKEDAMRKGIKQTEEEEEEER